MVICNHCYHNPCLNCSIKMLLLQNCLFLTGLWAAGLSLMSYIAPSWHWIWCTGSTNYTCILMCIVEFIWSIGASKNSRYTGHESTGGVDTVVDNGIEEDRDECSNFCTDETTTSYEEIKEEASSKLVDFDAEKNATICQFQPSPFQSWACQLVHPRFIPQLVECYIQAKTIQYCYFSLWGGFNL